MEQSRSYSLVGQQGLSVVVLLALPICFAIWIVLAFDSPASKSNLPEFPYAIAFIALFGTAIESYLLVHRWLARSARLVLDGGGLALYERSRKRWHVDFAEVDAVVLRTYTIRYGYFHEALIIKTKDRKTRLVPTASALYGQMPDLKDLIAQMAETDHPVAHDHWPTWVTPS